ncbi:hypothetical protein PQ469_14170 [Mucilaginibacter sp. KACC 22773]|uniref:hypothetical protein n=1 Tax=Mucilaginibacter sp. KACC 22773 TaxID=3025671 RepID=UPI002366C929|nr:hypothetical protein [Mucilaginibacter sp. KACC 22773]WDF81153.1 hypothetical protein PQ469_14170 [Mucilaginibacter sp. KACC 22773]
MENYKNKLGGLAVKLKQEKPRTPIQEVQPVKTIANVKVAEVQFNNWIPKSLLKRIKTYGVEHDLSLKDINIRALELYLSHKAKPEETTKDAL